MEAFHRCERLARLLILYKRATVMVLNDEDISKNVKFLYAVIFAHRSAETICKMRDIFDVF